MVRGVAASFEADGIHYVGKVGVVGAITPAILYHILGIQPDVVCAQDTCLQYPKVVEDTRVGRGCEQLLPESQSWL